LMMLPCSSLIIPEISCTRPFYTKLNKLFAYFLVVFDVVFLYFDHESVEVEVETPRELMGRPLRVLTQQVYLHGSLRQGCFLGV